MDFKYRWKNGAAPSRDQAATSEHLLDANQFESEKDHRLAEEMARKHLNVPLRTPDADRSVLPHGDTSDQADINQ
jgi:hypothetical protein